MPTPLGEIDATTLLTARLPDDGFTGRVVGNFRLIERLGVGGAATVFRAADRATGLEVAIKTLNPRQLAQPNAVERFLSEAKALSAVRHRGVVRVLGLGLSDEGAPFLVMEKLVGQTLDERSGGRPCPVSQVLTWAEQALAALEAVHARGVVHRDVKPANLFLTRSSELKLIDFGIARQLGADSHTTAGYVVGSPDYMAPEQVRGRELGPSTDVYALGCSLFELLTGCAPFDGKDELDVMAKHVKAPPRVPSGLVKGLPVGVDVLVLSMLQKDPAQRPPVSTLRARVAAMLTGDEVERASPTPRALPRWTWRWAAAAAGAGLSLVVGGLLLALCESRPPPEPADTVTVAGAPTVRVLELPKQPRKARPPAR